MRRVLLALALIASTLLLAPSALADGSCSLIANKPTHPSGTAFLARASCYPVHNITVTTTGWRRTPGQAWAVVVSGSSNTPYPMLNWTKSVGISTYNCAKDYRTTASYTASPGGHSGGATSSTLTHTC